MRKPGTDPNNVQMTDVLCDFCRREWDVTVPMVEGHHGSIICGRCLAMAYAMALNAGDQLADAGYSCTMCLEQREDPAWQSPMHAEAVICRRCIKLGAGTLERDADFQWKRPTVEQPGG